jgi:predicted small secreted protein
LPQPLPHRFNLCRDHLDAQLINRSVNRSQFCLAIAFLVAADRFADCFNISRGIGRDIGEIDRIAGSAARTAEEQAL